MKLMIHLRGFRYRTTAILWVPAASTAEDRWNSIPRLDKEVDRNERHRFCKLQRQLMCYIP